MRYDTIRSNTRSSPPPPPGLFPLCGVVKRMRSFNGCFAELQLHDQSPS